MEVSDPRYEHAGLRHVTVFSRALGRRADCTVWMPPGASGSLPLVVLLHGVYASHCFREGERGRSFQGNEPQTLAQLQHTHIVPIYSLHEDIRAGMRAVMAS